MWAILQIVGVFLVVAAHTYMRWAALNNINLLVRMVVNVGFQSLAAPFFVFCYAFAPGFFQPWFLGTTFIALFGFVASLIFFGEAVTIIKIVGAALTLAGAVLLII
jgi:hypothetical protein